MSKKNLIKEINDILKMNIICTNAEETKECFSILEKLGLKTFKDNNHKDYRNIVRTCIDESFFLSTYDLIEDCKNISFYDFKQETKKFLKPTIKENLQVDEKTFLGIDGKMHTFKLSDSLALMLKETIPLARIKLQKKKGKWKTVGGWISLTKKQPYIQAIGRCIRKEKYLKDIEFDVITGRVIKKYDFYNFNKGFNKIDGLDIDIKSALKTKSFKSEYLTTHQQLLDNVGKRVSCYVDGKFIANAKLVADSDGYGKITIRLETETEIRYLSNIYTKYEKDNNSCKRIKILEDKPYEFRSEALDCDIYDDKISISKYKLEETKIPMIFTYRNDKDYTRFIIIKKKSDMKISYCKQSFIKQLELYKKLGYFNLPKVEDIEYDKKTGRITKINYIKKGRELFIIGGRIGGRTFISYDGSISDDNERNIIYFMNLGLVYISKEFCEKAEQEMIKRVKEENYQLTNSK